MKKRLAAIALGLIIVFSFSGCDLFSPNNEDLLHAPRLTGELYPIEQALKASEKSAYTLIYPTLGDQRSAVMLRDIDGDGSEEAFVFYSTADDDVTTVNINAIVRKGEDWKSVAKQSMIASGLEKVEFSDLDQDGIEEIVVGWEVYAQSEKQLSVYTLKNEEMNSILGRPYTSFLCEDFDRSGTEELLIHLLNATDSVNTASLYTVQDGGVVQISGCMMDKAVSSARRPIFSVLADGTPAVYIDEVKGVTAVTEVLYLKDGKLVNPLLDIAEPMENTRTTRPETIFCKDIDGDGILEIPIASELYNADSLSTEKLYYINWCTFNGSLLAAKDVHIINSADGYQLDIPQKWIGNIAVLKDVSGRTRTIYSYDAANAQTGIKLVTFKAVNEKEWDKKGYKKDDFIEITRLAGVVYSYNKTSHDGELAVSNQTIEAMFSLVG